MALNLEEIKKAIDDDLANPNGHWRKIALKMELRKNRVSKVDEYIKKHGIKQIIDRIILEHGKKWEDKCWNKGYSPYPNNKFRLLLDWITETYEPVDNDLLPQDFLSASYFVNGYWFAIYCGQGCFHNVYDNELNLILHI